MRCIKSIARCADIICDYKQPKEMHYDDLQDAYYQMDACLENVAEIFDIVGVYNVDPRRGLPADVPSSLRALCKSGQLSHLFFAIWCSIYEQSQYLLPSCR